MGTAVSYPTNIATPITDNAAGIDPADLPRIFKRFYRTGQSRTPLLRRMGARV